jgi:hypothetical protein
MSQPFMTRLNDVLQKLNGASKAVALPFVVKDLPSFRRPDGSESHPNTPGRPQLASSPMKVTGCEGLPIGCVREPERPR